jgi:hypothetical protein
VTLKATPDGAANSHGATGIAPTMTSERFAIESWFFAPSTYPYEQVPIAF